MKMIEKMVDYILKGLKQNSVLVTDKYKITMVKKGADTFGQHYLIGISTEYKGYVGGEEHE